MKLKLTAATLQTSCNLDGRPRGDVVALCLEHDVASQGRDQHDAVIGLEASIVVLIRHAQEEGRDVLKVLGDPPPADAVAEFTGPRISFEVDSDEWVKT